MLATTEPGNVVIYGLVFTSRGTFEITSYVRIVSYWMTSENIIASIGHSTRFFSVVEIVFESRRIESVVPQMGNLPFFVIDSHDEQAGIVDSSVTFTNTLRTHHLFFRTVPIVYRIVYIYIYIKLSQNPNLINSGERKLLIPRHRFLLYPIDDGTISRRVGQACVIREQEKENLRFCLASGVIEIDYSLIVLVRHCPRARN